MSNGFTLVKDGNAEHPRLQDIVVSSKYSTPKIYTLANPAHAGNIFINWQSALTKAFGSTTIIDSFPHGFQYVPTVFATFKFNNGTSVQEGTLPFQYGALGIITIDADDTNINVKYHSTDLPGTTAIPVFVMQIRYYVMVEKGK